MRSSTRSPRFIRRFMAEQYLFLSVIVFAATVILTRLFLEMTGYPQLGNENLHIAHVLWGGLILFIATLISLTFANRGVYQVVAILSGIGMGLFIDEVGKFITRSNDYFYPPAAPIIYGVFLISVFVYLEIRSFQPVSARQSLYTALEMMMQAVGSEAQRRAKEPAASRAGRSRRACPRSRSPADGRHPAPVCRRIPGSGRG